LTALALPPKETLTAAAKHHDRYGLVIGLICVYLAALLLIGWYFPGTPVIIFAMIAASPEPQHDLFPKNRFSAFRDQR
jgi:hypothetical protein